MATSTGKSKKTSTAKTTRVEMVVDRDTKNTRRYEATTDDAPVSTLYVNKSAEVAKNDSIVLTITAG